LTPMTLVRRIKVDKKEDNMEVKLTKNQRAVANAANKSDKRFVFHPVLCCVHIRQGLIEASNGHILIQKKIDYKGEEKILLDIDEFKKLKDKKPRGGVLLELEGETVRDLGDGVTILTKQPGTFPDTDKLIPSGKPVFKIALSRKELKKLISALDNTDDAVQFYFYDSISPVKLEIPSEGTVALLMPMSLGEIV